MTAQVGPEPARRTRPRQTLQVPVPAGFSWRGTLYSHGWADLPPFRLDHETGTLHRVLLLDGRAVSLTMTCTAGAAIAARADTPLTRISARRAEAQIRRMLGLDEDLSAFYAAAGAMAGYEWTPAAGAGRLLRSPTVFEDLVRVLCTTNCSWALTKQMVGRLIEHAGEPSSGGVHAFPSPEALAERPERFFRERIRAGYRSGALRTLARDVAAGRRDVEGWAGSGLPLPELKKEILSIRGIGPYAAENMLRLLGRHEGPALDSWCRREFSERHGKGRPVSDRAILRHYAGFGSWLGLALWCDLTRPWLEADGSEPW